jgi:hypothetical protein
MTVEMDTSAIYGTFHGEKDAAQQHQTTSPVMRK